MENAKAAAKPHDTTTESTAPSEPLPWHQRFNAGDIVQSGREAADNYSAEAIKLLDKIKLEEMKDRAAELGMSIRSGNFGDAQAIGDKLGDSLDSDSIGACVNFFRIQSEKGSEAAREEIGKYVNAVNLSPEEREFLENLGEQIASMDTEDRINTVTFVTVLACDAKFGHGGGAIGILVGEALRAAFHVNRTDFDQDKSGEQGVDPNRSTAPLLNSESSVRGSDD